MKYVNKTLSVGNLFAYLIWMLRISDSNLCTYLCSACTQQPNNLQNNVITLSDNINYSSMISLVEVCLILDHENHEADWITIDIFCLSC